MAHGGDMSDRIKNQTLSEHADFSCEYDEAMDSAIGNFRDISICEPEKQLDLYGDSSQSCDLNQELSNGWVGDTRAEDELGDTSSDGEVDDTSSDYEVDETDDEVELTWEEKVVKVLNMIRRKESFEYNHKLKINVPTRLCRFNIALFDFDKESKIKPRPLYHDIPSRDHRMLENSVNVISVKIAASDVGYPVNIFGTVIARDEVDYRCVYLFNRGRDNPQLISSPDDTLILTGPDRALAVTDSMFFELHLKVKDDGEGDKDFCKGLLEHSVTRHTRQFMTLSLEGWLSTVQLAFTIVPFAVEASVTVTILNGPSNFIGKIVAWTTGNDNNEFIMYDSKVASPHMKHGTPDIELTRNIVAVPLDEDLVVNVSLGGNDCEAECLEFIIGSDFEKCTSTLGAYELQVKVVWRGVMRQRCPNMWEYFGKTRVLV